MARQEVDVDSPDSGQGDSLRAAFVKVNDMTTEIYADSFVTNARLADDAVDSDQIADGAVDTVHIGDDQITHDKLSARYTESEAVTSAATITINAEDADIFTWTAGHSATINFTNVEIGDVVTLEVTGGGSSYTLTLGTIDSASATYNKISGDYDDTSSTKNLIEFKFISATEAWYQISQIAS